jgi:hypothetical protein
MLHHAMHAVTPIRGAVDEAMRRVLFTPVAGGDVVDVKQHARRSTYGEGIHIDAEVREALLRPSADSVMSLHEMWLQSQRLRRMLVVYAVRPTPKEGEKPEPYRLYAAQLLHKEDLMERVINDDGTWEDLDDTLLLSPDMREFLLANPEKVPQFWVKLSPRTKMIPMAEQRDDAALFVIPAEGWQYAFVVSAVVFVNTFYMDKTEQLQRLSVDLRNQISTDRGERAGMLTQIANFEREMHQVVLGHQNAMAAVESSVQRETAQMRRDCEDLQRRLAVAESVGGIDDASQHESRESAHREAMAYKDEELVRARRDVKTLTGQAQAAAGEARAAATMARAREQDAARDVQRLKEELSQMKAAQQAHGDRRGEDAERRLRTVSEELEASKDAAFRASQKVLGLETDLGGLRDARARQADDIRALKAAKEADVRNW